MNSITMRWLVAVVFLAVAARCQQLAYSSDMFGHYVPANESGSDCPPASLKRADPPFPPTLQLDGEELIPGEDDVMESELTSHWADCGNGGVPRLAGALAAFRAGGSDLVTVTGGNILGAGHWELPVDVSAAVLAAAQFDVMGLGPGEFLRGTPFLRELLAAVNATGTTKIVACNVKSSLLEGLLEPSVTKGGILFVGVVDPAAVEDYVSFDSDIQLSSISCVQDEINRVNTSDPVVVVGSAASLQSGVLNVTGVEAFVISGLPDSDKETALQNLTAAADGTPVLVTEGHGKTADVFNISSGAVVNTTILDSSVPEITEVANDIAGLQQEVINFYATPFMSYFDLTDTDCDKLECGVGDVICDAALIGSLLDGRVTSQPMAVWPGQNLTGQIPKGNLTVQQLYSTLPTEQVAIANASGDTVIKLFARAVQEMTVDASSSKTFLQVSGVRVTYDLDLAPQYRAKYLMNLCLSCSPQEYLPVSPSLNYTVALPVSMLSHPDWSDFTSQFTGIHITGFSARDAVSAKTQATGRLLSPVGDRIDFTHIAPDVDPSPDTFVAVLSTVVVCMVVFGLGVFGFTVWSRRQNQFGSTTGLLR